MTPCSARKAAEILLARLLQDREVAAVDHLHPQPPRLAHELPELGMQLRRTAGEIEAAQPAGGQHLRDQRQGGCLHAFGAGGPALTWQCTQAWLQR